LDKIYGHDNNGGAATMWHTVVDAKPSAPVPGLPECPAWVRFDFKHPQAAGSCQIWNHNQLDLTNRGFRRARVFASADGVTFEKVQVNGKELFEIPRAKGTPAEPATFVLPLPGKTVKSIILAAEDNWGGNVYGLSELQFYGPAREMAAGDLPVPATVSATQFPFLFDEGKGAWSRQVNLELDVVLREPADVTVTCDGATRTTHFEAGPRGTRSLLADLPEGKGNRRRATDKLTVSIKAGSWTKQLETQIEPPQQWPDLEEVIVTWKCHLDIGYTHPAEEVIAKYRTSDMDKLLAVATGKELVDSSQHVLGQFLHERFSLTEVSQFVASYGRAEAGGWVGADFGKPGMPDAKTSPYLASTPKGWTVKATRTPLGETVVLTASDTLGLAKGYTLTFTFPNNQACVDIGWSVDSKTPDPIPEGGWLCLPFKVEAPSFRVGRVGGTIDPAKDIIFGSSRHLLAVDRGITVRAGESGAGMAAASADLPLWSLGEPGLWKYTADYVPTRPGLFVNLYNNMWNTNYPLWIGGSWKARLRGWSGRYVARHPERHGLVAQGNPHHRLLPQSRR
jgi:hypothetical protein